MGMPPYKIRLELYNATYLGVYQTGSHIIFIYAEPWSKYYVSIKKIHSYFWAIGWNSQTMWEFHKKNNNKRTTTKNKKQQQHLGTASHFQKSFFFFFYPKQILWQYDKRLASDITFSKWCHITDYYAMGKIHSTITPLPPWTPPLFSMHIYTFASKTTELCRKDTDVKPAKERDLSFYAVKYRYSLMAHRQMYVFNKGMLCS